MNEIKNLLNKLMNNFINYKLQGNEELVVHNIDRLNKVIDSNYLDEINSSEEAQEEILNARDHIIENKDDYVIYFRNQYLEEETAIQRRYTTDYKPKREAIKEVTLKSTAYKIVKWVIGISSVLMFSSWNLILNLIISLSLANGIPCIIEYIIKPYYYGNLKYRSYVDKMKDKLNYLNDVKAKKRDIDKEDIADLSLDIAKCINDIQQEPYPGCEREIDALKNLNYEFLAEELKSRMEPAKIELKLVFKDYKAAFEDIKKYVLEQQMIERSKKVVEEAIIDQPDLTPTKPKKLVRYRVKN